MTRTSPQDTQRPDDGDKPGIGDRMEQAQQAKDFLSGDEPEVVHCTKCKGAEKTDRNVKFATFFSLGAFAVSIATLAMQLLGAPEPAVSFTQEGWNQFVTGMQASASSGSPEAMSASATSSSSKPKTQAAASKQAPVKSSVSSVVAKSSDASSAAPASSAVSSVASSKDASPPVQPADGAVPRAPSGN